MEKRIGGYTFIFTDSIPQGYTVQKLGSDEFVVDTGNSNIDGCFDHHINNTFKSATEMVYENWENVIRRTERMENDSGTIKIMMHKYPDLDCIAAAWLITEIVKAGSRDKLPEGTKTLVRYVSMVDQGRLKIDKEKLCTPLVIFFSYFAIDKRSDYIITQTFELFEKFRNCFKDYDEKISGITYEEEISILAGLCFDEALFEKEIQVVRLDWDNYQSDKNRICIEDYEFKVFERKCGGECDAKDYCQLCNADKVTTCKALIWTKIPTCVLHKYWARNEGYVFTIIPGPPRSRKNEKDDFAFYECKSGKFPLSMVILSVDPEYDYCLKNLAVLLEMMECEKEKKLLGSSFDEKRTRERVRGGYDDQKWVTNLDPWYDGKDYLYTIVDTPSSDSLLSWEEILYAARHYTEKGIRDVEVRAVFPFIYNDLSSFDKIKGIFSGKKGMIPCQKDEVMKSLFPGYIPDFLRDHVEKYFFGFNDETLKQCDDVKWFDITGNFDNNECTDTILKLVVYDSGIGFFITSFDIQYFRNENSIDFGKVNEITGKRLKELDALCREMLKAVPAGSDDDRPIQCKLLEPVTHTYYSVNRVFYHYLNAASHIIHHAFYDTSDTAGIQTEGESTVSGDGFLLGLSASQNILVEDTNKSAPSGRKHSMRDLFLNQFFIEYLLAVHQSEALLNFRLLIGHALEHDKHGDISCLREHYINFIAKGYYSIVTNDSMGSMLYSRWQKHLMIEQINTEVHEQIDELDEIETRKFEKTISMVTFILLPVSIVLALIQSAFSMNNDQSIFMRIFICVMISAFFGWAGFLYFKKKDRNIRK